MILRRLQFAASTSPCDAASSGPRGWISFVAVATVFSLSLPSNAADAPRKISDDDDAPAVVDENLMVVAEDDFNANVIGRRDDAEDRARQRMREAVRHEIVLITARCSLTPEQQAKLELAGRGDVARCFERLAELRRKGADAPMTRADYGAFWTSVESVRWAMQNGWFNESSLFWKTLQRTLTAEQLAQFRELERQRGLKILKHQCDYLETTTLTKLSGDCRRKFEELLTDKVRPMELTGPYTSYVWLEAAKFQDEFKPLMRERQWRVFVRAIVDAKRGEQSLRKCDRWPYDAPADEPNKSGETKDENL